MQRSRQYPEYRQRDARQLVRCPVAGEPARVDSSRRNLRPYGVAATQISFTYHY